MNVKSANFIRWVGLGENIDELVNEARGKTWESETEHSLVELEAGELALVSGGRDGIQFIVKGKGEGRTLHMEIEGREARVVRIHWHTHPLVTGPSDGDLEALAILGQAESFIVTVQSLSCTRFGWLNLGDMKNIGI